MPDYNQTQLDKQLRDHADMSDDALVAIINAPILTPRTGMITYTAVGAILGAMKAITLRATLLGAVSQGSAFSPIAGYVHDLLSGPGFDAGNADVQAMAGQFVTAGILTQADATTLLFATTYPAGGSGSYGLADIQAARAAIARAAALTAIQQWANTVVPQANALIAAAAADPTVTVPSQAQYAALIASAVQMA